MSEQDPEPVRASAANGILDKRALADPRLTADEANPALLPIDAGDLFVQQHLLGRPSDKG